MTIPITGPTTSFKNSSIQAQIQFLAGNTDSEGVSCTELINTPDPITRVSGTLSLRMLSFPVLWTTCDVSIMAFNDETYTDGFLVNLFDGNDKSPFIIPACASNEVVPIIPFITDAITHFKIICSVPQPVETFCTGYFQPIYQVSN